VEHHARRRRQFLRLAWNFALVFVASAMGAGVWLAYIAWQLASQQLGMLSVALLLSAPMLAVAVILARRAGSTGQGNPLASDFLDAIHQVDDSLRIVRLCRAHVGVACSYVFVLWFCQLAGYFRLLHFLVFYTVACSVAAAACLPWLAARERRLYDDRSEYRRLLREAEAAPWSAFTGRRHAG
jgi:hypothetical protein